MHYGGYNKTAPGKYLLYFDGDDLRNGFSVDVYRNTMYIDMDEGFVLQRLSDSDKDVSNLIAVQSGRTTTEDD